MIFLLSFFILENKNEKLEITDEEYKNLKKLFNRCFTKGYLNNETNKDKDEKRNEEVILQMMILASNWNHNEIEKVKSAFENRENDYSTWLSYKEKYYKFFVDIKNVWDDSKEKNRIDTYNELFK